ncbi:MAG: D-alanine--D-alanine ligase [bacterium]|nr:D-alanine--D-alanine ligase [bacterium]
MFKGKKILIIVGKEEVRRKDVQDVLRCKAFLEKVLLKKGLITDSVFITKKDFRKIESLKNSILSYKPDCIFNLFEGFSDDSQKEAEFVRVLEKMNIPFTGNPSFSINICLDKEKTKKILRENRIPSPKGIFLKNIRDLDKYSINMPVFVKPCFEDASLGIDKDSLITDKNLLSKILSEKLEEFPKGLIIEEFISGNEYNLGFLGEYPYELLGVSILDYSRFEGYSPFLTYRSKWKTDSGEFKKLLPSLKDNISKELKSRLVNLAKKAGRVLKCRNYFRIDIREKNGKIFILDVNPNPDINMDSGFMKQGYKQGYKYEDIIEKILLHSFNCYSGKKYA